MGGRGRDIVRREQEWNRLPGSGVLHDYTRARLRRADVAREAHVQGQRLRVEAEAGADDAGRSDVLAKALPEPSVYCAGGISAVPAPMIHLPGGGDERIESSRAA